MVWSWTLNYNGRAFLRHIGNDVHITVRAPFPERFLGMLTEEVKYLVESFWEGLRCDVTVPCIEPLPKKAPGTGLFEVNKLMKTNERIGTSFRVLFVTNGKISTIPAPQCASRNTAISLV